jgi:hypothetical protein
VTEQSKAFAETYAYYVKQIAALDLSALAPRLGAKVNRGTIMVSFFGRPFTIGPRGISGPSGRRPSFDTCIVLFKYVLLSPSRQPEGAVWSAFRDFKDSGPLTAFFVNDVERRIADHFAGRPQALASAGQNIGGRPPALDLTYDVCLQFEPLARVPLLLLFNDRDEEFPAQSSVLFEKRAQHYLDAECLAILGGLLYAQLKRNDPSSAARSQ